MTAAWLYLAASALGALLTVAALVRARPPGVRGVLWWLAGWGTGELPYHHIAWQALATLAFAALGALEAWPGVLGLAITFASWAGLLRVHSLGRAAGRVAPGALREALGEGHRLALTSKARARLREEVPVRERLLPFAFRSPGVERLANIPYGEVLPGDRGGRNLLDVYRSRSGVEGAPVLFQIHGGAWITGEKNAQGRPLMKFLAERGWVCFAINYRLSPQATYPDHIVDVKRALAWVREHAAEYGGDPGFVCVTGGSAGGHLAALAGLTGNDPRFQPGFEDRDTSVQACVPFYGVYDLQDRAGLRPGAPIEPFLRRQVFKCTPHEQPELWENASPLTHVHEKAPPFLIVQGTHDTLVWVEEARHFAARLREKSRSPVAYLEFAGAQHAFDLFHCYRAGHAVNAVGEFLEWVRAAHAARA